MRITIKSILIILLSGFIFFTSCEKEIIKPPNKNATEIFYDIMQEWYLWNNDMPELDTDNFNNPEDVLDVLRNDEYDKWSYITSLDAFNQYFEAGTYIGYGYGQKFDENDNLRISFVFTSSPLIEHNISRGWIVREINGEEITPVSDISGLMGSNDVGVSNNFLFESPAGDSLNLNLAKSLITMNTVIYKNVIDVNDKKVGHLVFKSFIGPSIDELNDVFNYFKSENIDELILDLRYNGGGRMDVTLLLAGLIIPQNLDGKLFTNYIHNSNKSYENFYYNVQYQSNSAELEKLYIITGNNTASASEVIINCLKPYIDIYTIGNDTYGKPVGMYAFSNTDDNLAYVPICFKLTNANDEGDYYDGLQADAYAEDNLSKDFSDIQEDCFSEAIHHIEFGCFSSRKSKQSIFIGKKKEIYNLKTERGAY